MAHPKVSRQHCQIFERDGVLVVRDNESLNGTFIDNEKITEAILKPGDKLTVGPLTFVAVYEHAGSFPTLNATNQTVVQPIVPNKKIVTVDKSERHERMRPGQDRHGRRRFRDTRYQPQAARSFAGRSGPGRNRAARTAASRVASRGRGSSRLRGSSGSGNRR